MFTQAELRERFNAKRKRIINDNPCSIFAVAMPRFVGPGCWMYDIENAIDRSVVGLAVGAKFRLGDTQCEPDAELFCIWVAAGVYEFSVHGKGFAGNELLRIRNKEGGEVLWRRWASGLTFSAVYGGTNVGHLTSNKLSNSANWVPEHSTRSRAEFTTGVSRPLAVTMRRLFHIGERPSLRNDNVVFDSGCDYGLPGWAMGGVLLGIRMMLVAVDFE